MKMGQMLPRIIREFEDDNDPVVYERGTKVGSSCEEICKNKSIGKDPTGITAAALYLACIKTGENVTQKNATDASRICSHTLEYAHILSQALAPVSHGNPSLNLSCLSTNFYLVFLTKQSVL